MLRKATGTAAALIAWKWPEAAVAGFLLWLYWEPLDRLATRVWDDWMCARTERALREDPNAAVEGFYVLMLSRRRRRRGTARRGSGSAGGAGWGPPGGRSPPCSYSWTGSGGTWWRAYRASWQGTG